MKDAHVLDLDNETITDETTELFPNRGVNLNHTVEYTPYSSIQTSIVINT